MASNLDKKTLKDPKTISHSLFQLIYLISYRGLDLFSLVPNISNGCHEMSAMVHGDWAEQLEDLLTEILGNRCEESRGLINKSI